MANSLILHELAPIWIVAPQALKFWLGSKTPGVTLQA
jgi:hypothetical protein